MTRLILYILLILSTGPAHTQPAPRLNLQWQNVDSLYAPLPGGVHVFKTETTIDGKPNRAFYVSLPLKSKHLLFDAAGGPRQTPSTWFNSLAQPLVVVNTTFFSLTANNNLNMIVSDGKLEAYNVHAVPAGKNKAGQYNYVSRAAIGISKKGKADVAWPYTDTGMRKLYAWQVRPPEGVGADPDPSIDDITAVDKEIGKPGRWKIKTAAGGGPALVQQGRIAIFNNDEKLFVSPADTVRHPRTAMGYTANGNLVILAIEGRNPGIAEGVSLEQEAAMLVELNCQEALNLDGGGSSCLLINGKETIHPSDKAGQRTIPGIFIVRQKK